MKLKKNGLGIESLEQRQLLAGDVIVAIVDGDVVVRGDHEANQVRAVVAGSEGNTLVVEGIDTTINGQDGPFILQEFDQTIRFNMAGGNDVVRIPDGGFAGDLQISTGRGADIVALGRGMSEATDPPLRIDGRLAVDLGPGDDVLGASRVVSERFAAFGSAGDDDIALDHVHASDTMLVRAGWGADRLAMANSSSPMVSIDTGMGNDRLALMDSVFGNLEAQLGHGNDRAVIGGITVQNALIRGGSGRDALVNLGENSAANSFVVGFEFVRDAETEDYSDDDGDNLAAAFAEIA